jgi:predicted nucleic acid-binding protein
MTPLVFVDTSAWLALVNKSDIFHLKAKEIRDNLVKNKVKFVVTDYIIVEIANCLSRIPLRSAAIQLISFIKASEQIEIVPIGREIYDEAWDLYSRHQDKEWGFTDCTSFVVMNRNGIKQAFTTDHHFEQAGFTILLKD